MTPKDMEDSLDMELGMSTPNVTRLRRLAPGEILDVILKLRQLLTTIDTTAYTLYASFEELGSKTLEQEAEKTRHTLELGAARVAALLALAEGTKYYQAYKEHVSKVRKEKKER